MAALTSEQRDAAMRQLVNKMFVDLNQTAQLDTNQVRLLINGLDDYIEANASAINQSIDPSVRSLATTPQKALAVAFVAMKRGGLI